MKKHKYNRLIFSILMVVLLGFLVQADDKELFMGFQMDANEVRPNVVILMDNSGSMNTIIFYPQKGLDGISGTADDGYHHNTQYSGWFENYSQMDTLSSTQWIGRWIVNGNAYQYDTGELENIDGKNHWTGCYAGDTTPNNFQCGDNGTDYFEEGDRIMFRDTSAPYFDALATIKRKYTDASGNTWFELEDMVGGPITVNGGHFQRCPESQTRVPVVIQLYGVSDDGNPVRYPQNYVEWMYIHATPEQQAAISHFSTWGTFDVNVEPVPVLSNCATPGNDDLANPNPRIKQTFTRIQTAREVICTVASTSNTIVKLGLFKFTYDNGSTLQEGLSDMSDESSELVAYKNNVWDIAATTWTPLSEALADIWYYYKPGPASKTYWPVDYEIDNNTVNHSVSNPVTPVEWWCQNNYVVIMTDGESTQDRFDDYTKYGSSIFKQRPVKRTEPWTSWDDGWGDTDNNETNNGVPSNYNPTSTTYCPNYTCWDYTHGSDYLDDVAYFLRHQDMFPDSFFGTDPETGWPGEQNIYTYTIGFNADNDLLLQTAISGDGAYYTATNYDELVEAFQLVITSINLRNFGFSSITAPRKTATANNQTLTVSYVGYFMPSQAASIWEGHLLAFRLIDLWGFDTDDSGVIETHEYVYDTREDCINNSGGKECLRVIDLPIGHEWDVRNKMPSDRNLFTHISPDTSNIPFDLNNRDTLRPLFSPLTTDLEAEQIITKIRLPQLGDIFHADVTFVGPPSFSKQFLANINPPGDTDEKYITYYNANQNRAKVLYTGTNDGILHMIYADGVNAGEEAWGFIPDEVLPSLRTIAVDNEHTYTVDGRLSVNDVYFQKEGQTLKTWSTIMTFGLRRGGNAFYTMDITNVGSAPNLLWKFKDSTWSGESWGKPIITRIRVVDPNNEDLTIDKYVIIFAGGFAYNSEYSDDQRGKAIFMVDAGTGELIWLLGYDANLGAADTINSPDQEVIEVISSDSIHYLTRSDYFNFPIPTSLTVIDKDNNGFADTLYFGNIGGHLFKTDISSFIMDNWTTYLIYKTDITTRASTTIESINDAEIGVVSKDNFLVGDTIMGLTSHTYGYIRTIDNKVWTVAVNKGAFLVDETIVCRTYDPIYLAPALSYDTCYQLWVSFGTGDRDRPRTSNHVGRFISIKDAGNTNLTLTDLSHLTWGSSNEDAQLPQSELSGSKGWYFNFGDNYEKMFDPDPVVLPDKYGIPHILFNTYQPPGSSTLVGDNPCNAPQEGNMTFYDIAISTCGAIDTLEGERSTGRIAGGGVYNAKEYVLYKSESGNVADVPGADSGVNDHFEDNFLVLPSGLRGIGGVVFWKEKKR